MPVGCLGCVPDVPEVAWIRALAISAGSEPDQIWSLLWEEAVEVLKGLGAERAAALVLDDWFEELVRAAGFERTNSVIFYDISLDAVEPENPEWGPADEHRPIELSDAADILSIDEQTFEPAWQLSNDSLTVAMMHASSATLISRGGQVVGYQITTSSPFGAHLARLAVHPAWQRQGLGSDLIKKARRATQEQGLGRLSVNTQTDNSSSRRLYEKLGFQATGQQFPVYELDWLS